MAKRRSIIARAKKAEREVQQYLFPGTTFAGHAKRPALEDEDLRGLDYDGTLWWGECKALEAKTTQGRGGPWAVLEDAYNQCCEAIERNPHEGQVPRPFAVLRAKGTQLESPQNLVMYKTRGRIVIIRLTDFKLRIQGISA